jgi:hypothetical protein
MGKNMIEKDKFNEYRIKVLERMNIIDFLISAIIARSYISQEPSKIPYNFISNVLYQPPLSFSSRVDMLKNVFKQNNRKEKDLIKKLKKLAEIRNNFTHCEIRFEFEGQESYIVNLRNVMKKIDFLKDYEEFNEIVSKIEPFLIAYLEGLLGKKIKSVDLNE